MPTYEYRCTDCGQSFERFQSFSDDPITVCPLPNDAEAGAESVPVCGGEVRKVFSNVGISFKGSGFYRNDSRSEGKSKSKSSGSSTSDSSTSDGESASRDPSDGSSKNNGSKSNGSTDRSSTQSASKDSSAVGAASASG